MRSSLIVRHDYDAASATLTVTFVAGRIYAYYGVPEELAAAFGIALSKGRFFNERIRDAYRCRELDPVSRVALW
ncbi:MAG: KTSC domain-containing protein [Bauldia sp.]